VTNVQRFTLQVLTTDIGNLLLVMSGKLRFGELKKKLPNITERMLTLQLRKLEENVIITRTVYAEVPPRVEYKLTPIGYALKPVKELEDWGGSS